MTNKEQESALSIDDLNKVTGGEDDGGQNGFRCLVCHNFIPASVLELFQKTAVKCPTCGLELRSIDNLKNDSGE